MALPASGAVSGNLAIHLHQIKISPTAPDRSDAFTTVAEHEACHINIGKMR